MTSNELATYLRRVRETDDAVALARLRAELDSRRAIDPDARMVASVITTKRRRLLEAH